MGKHCLQLVLTLLLLHGDFPNKLMRKIHAEQCLALYSRLGLSAVQTSQPARHTAIPFLFCRCVMYCIMYHIVTTVSGYVSYCGKMYRCRPTVYHTKTLIIIIIIIITTTTTTRYFKRITFLTFPKVQNNNTG